MTIEHKGGARVPGPLDFYSGRMGGGRIPGPLGVKRVAEATPAASKATKVFKMPAPAGGAGVSTVHVVASPLFSDDTPAPTDVVQGRLANCPVAAILAALAHTPNGQKRIHDLVTENKAVVETDLTDVADKLETVPKGKKCISNRYFCVKLEGKTIEVSDVFYTDDGDRDTWSLIFMGAPPLGKPGEGPIPGPPKTVWPSAIEKAYAVKVKGYEDLDDDSKHKVKEFWEVLVGVKPQGFAVDDKTDLDKIRDVAKAASTVPALGASRDNATGVLNHHGFAILGIGGSNIELYDPHGRTLNISLKDFRLQFQAVFYGNPRS